jgi:hypothetical protein
MSEAEVAYKYSSIPLDQLIKTPQVGKLRAHATSRGFRARGGMGWEDRVCFRTL